MFPLVLFAPGAGAPSSSPWMRAWAARLGSLGRVAPIDYPYALLGRRRPDPLPRLIAAHRAALAVARSHGAVVLAGKSMGGRVGCHAALADLPSEIRRRARLAYALFSEIPQHPSLRFNRFMPSCRSSPRASGPSYRALAVQDGSDFVWFWIGTHAEYEALLRRL